MAATTPRKRRRILKILAIATVLSAAGVAALPWLLSTLPARPLLVAMANRYLKPSRIDIKSIGLSWTGPLRVSGLSVRDPKGKKVIAVSVAKLNRSLVQLALDHQRLGTLTLEGPRIDVERRADGSIDLLDVLPRHNQPSKPATESKTSNSSSLPTMTVKVVNGSLKLRSPELPDPFVAERFDMTLKVPATPGPVNLDVKLEQGTAPDTVSLAVVGQFDQKEPSDLSVTLTGTRWPWSANASGVVARGRLDGKVDAKRAAGLWTISGDARVLEVVAQGPALSGDRLKLDRVTATWDLGQTPRSWTVRKLDVDSPVLTLGTRGTLSDEVGASTQINGRVDLAALARQLPHTLRLRDGLALEKGEASVRAELKNLTDGQRYEIDAKLSDLIAREQARTITLRDPATISARMDRHARNVRLEQLTARTDFMEVSGSGDLDRGVTVKGSLDLAALQAQLHELLDLGALNMSGRGRWVADYRRTSTGYAGRMAAEFRGLDVKGLASEPIRRDLARVDAIVRGPAAESGLPSDWADAKLNLKADPTVAALSATSSNGAMTLVAAGSTPMLVAGHDSLATAKFAGRWASGALDLDELRLGLGSGPNLAASALDLAVKGRFDRASGDLALTPLSGTRTSAIALTAQGLHVTGLGKLGTVPKVEGTVFGDLAALDQVVCLVTGGAPYGLGGAWTANVSAEPTADGRLRLDVNLGSPDLSLAASDGKGRRPEGPFGATLKGWYQAAAARLDLESLTLGTRYGVVTASGRINDPMGRRVLDVQGNLAPNWATVKMLVASAVEPGATLEGGPARHFRIRGPMSGGGTAEVLKGLDAELGVDLTQFRAFGMTLGATPLVVRCGGGRTVIDPIETTLNNGKVDLRPEIRLDDPKGLALFLAPGSSITGAEINEEVTRRVLAYVAPVLQEATEARGHVSAGFQQAVFPIGGDASRTMTVNGQIVFDNVEFGAGPMASELLAAVGRKHSSTLRLQQPVQLSIADGRINQSGLEIPISRDAKVTVKGSVGLDQTLALTANVPVSAAAMLGVQNGLPGVVEKGATITIPIGGTLSRPAIDERALRVALGKAGESLLKKNAAQEASKLLKGFGRNIAPASPAQAGP